METCREDVSEIVNEWKEEIGLADVNRALKHDPY